MNKYFLFTALAFATILTGCSNEEGNIELSGENKINLFIDGPASRITTIGNATTFDTGDQIAINSVGLAPEMENETFTVAADGSLEANLSFYYDGNKSAHFYAHYPVSASHSQGTVTVTVPTIQNGVEQYNATDFMTATATGSASTNNGGVYLKFSHRLSLVKIIWEGSTTATDIELFGIKPGLTWTYATDLLTPVGDATNIVMWKVDASKQEYWALIPPQTIAKGTKLLEIKDGDKVYPYTPNIDITFNDKHVRKITLNAKEENGPVEVVMTNISIESWEEDDEISEGDLESTTLPKSILIDEATGKFTGVTALTALTKNTTKAGVWGFDADTDDDAKIELVTCPVDENTKAIHINIPKYKKDSQIETKWYENALYYQLTDKAAHSIKLGKLYKLTFKLRSNSLTKQQLRMNVMQSDLNNQFFPITQEANKDKELGASYIRQSDNSTQYYWLGTQYPFVSPAKDGTTDVENTAYEDKTYYVNFAKITTAGNGSSYREEPCSISDFGHVTLAFAVNSGYGIDFYIKDITFEEYEEKE